MIRGRITVPAKPSQTVRPSIAGIGRSRVHVSTESASCQPTIRGQSASQIRATPRKRLSHLIFHCPPPATAPQAVRPLRPRVNIAKVPKEFNKLLNSTNLPCQSVPPTFGPVPQPSFRVVHAKPAADQLETL